MPEPHLATGAGARPDLQRRFRCNPRAAHQVLEDKAVVLHYEGKRILGLNQSGTLVWSMLDGRRTLEQIAREAALQSGACVDDVAADISAFVDELRSRDLVIEVEQEPPEK